MNRPGFFSALAVVLALSAAPAMAQAPRPERPYRGLFASGSGDAGQELTASGSLATGWDDNLLAAATGSNTATPGGRGPQSGGSIANVSAALNYSLQTDAITLSAGASTVTRYFPGHELDAIRATQGRVGVSGSPRQGTSVSFSAGASHQPYALRSLFPTSGLATDDAPDLDAAAGRESFQMYSTEGSVTQRLSPRTSLSGGLSYRTAERPGEDRRFTYQRASSQLSQQIGRGLSLRGGYGYGQSRFADDRQHPHHNIDVGVDFNRPLSLTRRTTVSFSTGSTASRTNDRLRFHLTGSARLVHEMGRTWSVWTAYGRQLQFHETWGEPGMANSVSAGVGGFVTRRLQLSGVVRGAVGKVGTDNDSPDFDSYYGNASLSYALARFMAVGVSYGYYHHRFDESVLLAAGIPRALDRQSVRATVSLWAPLFQRSRRNDASR